MSVGCEQETDMETINVHTRTLAAGKSRLADKRRSPTKAMLYKEESHEIMQAAAHDLMACIARFPARAFWNLCLRPVSLHILLPVSLMLSHVA